MTYTDLTYEDCLKFKEEHSDMNRTYVKDHYVSYHRAMMRFGIFDELYPSKAVKYDLESAIAEAKKFKTKKEFSHLRWTAVKIIEKYHMEDVAYAHFDTGRNWFNRLVYVYEFEERKTAYIGITCNYERRNKQHMEGRCKSPVYNFIKETGIMPTAKQITEYIPFNEARILEGEYIKKYKDEGWVVLNKAKAGGLGHPIHFDLAEQILELNKQGLSLQAIADKLGVGRTTVMRRSRNLEGYVPYKEKHYCRSVELLNENGEIVKRFESLQEAITTLSIPSTTLRKKIKKGKLNNYIIRYGG